MNATDITVGREIARQLGRALVMIGAKNLAAGADSLSFKIGRNAGKWTHVKIELNPLDLYNMTFYRFWNGDVQKQETVEGVYFDQMKAVIEEKTGLYTSL